MTFAHAISEDEAAALARFAGIPVEPERLSQLAAEFTTIAALIADMDTVDVAAIDPVPPPFDAGWPESEGVEA